MINKKKGQLSSEYIVIVFSIIISGLVLFFVNNMISTVQVKYENIEPSLNYEFPLAYTYSFLMMPLKEDDKKNFSNYNNIDFVKDLFWINTDESKKLIDVYRENYISTLSDISRDKGSDSIYLFSKFSNTEISTNNLLNFEYDISKDNLDTIDDMIFKTDIIIPIKTQSGSFSLVQFNGDN